MLNNFEVDTNDRYRLTPRISRDAGDEWQEMVHIARTSYVVSRKWINAPYEKVNDLIARLAKREEFKDVTNRIFRDAVECVARLSLKAWERFVD